MMLAEQVANDQVALMASRLDSGRAVVLNAAGIELVSVDFAAPAFPAPTNGRALANPLRVGIASADGIPKSFEAYDASGRIVLAGTAGHRDDDPEPEMRFKVRQIIRDADVIVEFFELSIKNIIPSIGHENEDPAEKNKEPEK